MIPADLASRLRLVSQDLPSPVQPATPAQKITDVLSELSAGQRIMAEIQSLLPNGSYRAVVAQREITLALPFSAKAGDTLELEVVESDGQLTLAFIANRSSATSDAKGNESVATTLSKTGNLISTLLHGAGEDGGQAKPAALNGNQALVSNFPEKASDLAPILKDSLIKSGMFYEAHQARWVEGRLSVANLLQEPQGQFSSLQAAGSSQNPLAGSDTGDSAEIAAHVHLSEASLQKTASEADAKRSAMAMNESNASNLRATESAARDASGDTPLALRGNPVHPELASLVQQQLNALATQTYVWQGQVWPGQKMHWEISENDGRPRSGEEEVSGNWQTRLKLDLPNLGGIEARIGLDPSGKLSVLLRTGQEDSQSTLQAAAADLGAALQTAGLQLNKFTVTHGEIAG